MSGMEHVAYISEVEETTKIDLRETGWEVVDWITLIQDEI
jgi:hypothetical protein